MRWINIGSAAVIISLCPITPTPFSELRAEPVIIKYEGPNRQSYKPGKKLAQTAKITLKAGELLTVLDERGTRTLRGPGTFNASSAVSAGAISNASLAGLIRTSSVRRARTGAVRGEAPAQQARLSPNLWFVDITKSARICVPDFQNLQLWRSNTEDSQNTITIANSSGSDATVKFGKGSSVARWPSTLTPVAGARYTISAPGGLEKVSIEMVGVDVTGEERLDTMALKLLDRGCQTQSELLAATFAQKEASPAGGQ